MSYYHDDDGSDEDTVQYAKNVLVWTVLILAFALGVLFLIGALANGQTRQRVLIIGGCNDALWKHVYHPERLLVHEICVSVTGTVVDATHGKQKDGVRHEADGDSHGWLKLDPGQEKYINAGNVSDEEGNLVYEVVCLYKVTQKDAMQACGGYKNKVKLAPVGSHVRISGSWVQDDNHAKWNELHPVTSLEVIP